MTEVKHTPGPWMVNKYCSIGAGERGTNPIVCQVELFHGTDKRFGSHSANAHLIAAAPDMYEALEGIKWKSSDRDNMEFTATITCFQMDAIRVALAKARGEEK